MTLYSQPAQQQAALIAGELVRAEARRVFDCLPSSIQRAVGPFAAPLRGLPVDTLQATVHVVFGDVLVKISRRSLREEHAALRWLHESARLSGVCALPAPLAHERWEAVAAGWSPAEGAVDFLVARTPSRGRLASEEAGAVRAQGDVVAACAIAAGLAQTMAKIHSVDPTGCPALAMAAEAFGASDGGDTVRCEPC